MSTVSTVPGSHESPVMPRTDSLEKKSRFTFGSKGEKDDAENQVDPLDKHAQAAREGVKPAFLAKVEVLNDAIQEIGMGRYQVELFFTAGESRNNLIDKGQEAKILFPAARTSIDVLTFWR